MIPRCAIQSHMALLFLSSSGIYKVIYDNIINTIFKHIWHWIRRGLSWINVCQVSNLILSPKDDTTKCLPPIGIMACIQPNIRNNLPLNMVSFIIWVFVWPSYCECKYIFFIKQLKPNGYLHHFYLEDSILHWMGVWLIFLSLL